MPPCSAASRAATLEPLTRPPLDGDADGVGTPGVPLRFDPSGRVEHPAEIKSGSGKAASS
jgi:hypothetical protein